MSGITVERLSELLDYDQRTGEFMWKVNRGRLARAEGKAGNYDRAGYKRVCIDGVRYSAHRLAWLHTYGVWPSGEIDHINRIKDDNRICNLREVTRSQNIQNSGLKSTNTSGHRGVTWHKATNKWLAKICIHGKSRHLGLFIHIEDAIDVYVKAASTCHTHNPHGEVE